jgi:uncharacterized membrane protein
MTHSVKRHFSTALFTASLFLASVASASALTLTYLQEIIVPDAMYTLALGINEKNEVVGFYGDQAGTQRAFLFDPRTGAFETFSIYPVAGYFTVASGINNKGQIVGSFSDTNGPNAPCNCLPNSGQHGFLMDRNGSITVIDIPGGYYYSYAVGINNKGVIVGQATRTGGTHGYLVSSNGTLTIFDAEAGGTTFPSGINSRGEVVGFAYPPSGFDGFAFLRRADGEVEVIEVPGAIGGADARDINDHGFIVGSYSPTGVGLDSGFVRSPAGDFLFGIGNSVNGINNAGFAVVTDGHGHSFLVIVE